MLQTVLLAQLVALFFVPGNNRDQVRIWRILECWQYGNLGQVP
jgi:hypothetical protein